MLALVMTLSLAACGGSKQEEAPADNAGNGEAAGDTQDFGGAELVVATWGWAEAGLKTLAADFESKYNCTIVVDPTSGNGDRLNKLMAEQNDPTADVALLTKSFAQTGNEAGLFEKIDTNIVTSIGDLYDIAVNADGYGPCYSLCRYGIMYNADALEKAGLPAPTSYEGLFDDQYAHMVALPDMTSTAGPYMLVAMAEAMGGSQEDVTPAMELMQEKKDNIDLWYSTSSDVVNAFTTGEANIAVFMDINMPSLTDSGLNMVWVDAAEGSFSAPATANVVKNCKNPELAQLFVEYLISKDTQDKIAEVMNEAPVNKNATMDDSLKTYLAFGDESMNALKEFDEAYITANKGSLDRYLPAHCCRSVISPTIQKRRRRPAFPPFFKQLTRRRACHEADCLIGKRRSVPPALRGNSACPSTWRKEIPVCCSTPGGAGRLPAERGEAGHRPPAGHCRGVQPQPPGSLRWFFCAWRSSFRRTYPFMPIAAFSSGSGGITGATRLSRKPIPRRWSW